MNRVILRSFTALMVGALTLTVALFGSKIHADAGEPREVVEASTHILRSDQGQLHFVLETPDPVENQTHGINIAGLTGSLSEEGAPALPIYTTFLALPPGADVEVEIVNADIVSSPVVNRLAPVGAMPPLPQSEDSGAIRSALDAPIFTEAMDIYQQDAKYPGVHFRLSEPMYYRDLRLVRLELFPLQYNPVRARVYHAPKMEVRATFTDPTAVPAPSKALDDDGLEAVAPLVLNFAQAEAWRGLPPQHDEATTPLPVNHDTFKIAVDEDGIYEVSYADLAAAGMDVGAVDPTTFEMMYRGEPVAYQFMGNGNSQFEPGEKIRFYGWKFDGSRLQRQFLSENVFWLWADGTPALITDSPSASSGSVASTFRESLTFEEDTVFTHVWTGNWENAPNEPDSWIWDRVPKTGTAAITRTFPITLPVPAPSGSNAQVTVELLSRESNVNHEVSIHLNDDDSVSQQFSWTGARSVNVTLQVPAHLIQEGTNQVHVVYHTSLSSGVAFYYMNRITVEYDRYFVAGEEQLAFDEDNGPHMYEVGGFSQDGDVLVWEIDERLNPVAVTGVSVSGSDPYTYAFGTPASQSSFIVTHGGNIRTPKSITKYVGPDLNPAAGASWVVISHANFMNEAQRLAAHRSAPAFGGHPTHVVDVQHIINQYGYGLPLPEAIRHYLRQAFAEWPVAPQYLLLMGDGHINPRQLPCSEGNAQCADWAPAPTPNYVLTDIVYTDQFVGLNPSDYSYSLLVGNDLLPDLAVGRLPVESAAEAHELIDKIIQFETARVLEPPAAWQSSILFIADDDDTAGGFCAANAEVAALLPNSISHTAVCLEDNSHAAIGAAQEEITYVVNDAEQGVTFMNYRGHGAIRAWAGNLVNLDDEDNPYKPFLNNEPLIILSMDCLDGHFAMPGVEALSEVFMSDPYSSVAHWSSTGFGLDSQHDILHHAFYVGLYDHDMIRMGDAVNFAKLHYSTVSYDQSQLYSFLLQGDPAMFMTRLPTYALHLPAFNG